MGSSNSKSYEGVTKVEAVNARSFQDHKPKDNISRAATHNSGIHKVLNEDAIQSKRVFVIGDVHGCYDELHELLIQVNAFSDDIIVLFVGDMLNKGPKNIEVMSLLRQNKHFHCIVGNHEEKVLQKAMVVHTKSLKNKWQWIAHLGEEDIAYLNALPYTLSIPSLNAMLVHAGFVPGTPIEEQKLHDMTHIRNVVQDDAGVLHGTEKKGGTGWAKLWNGPEHVFFGHDANRGLQQHTFCTGLDTRCVYGGELTGVFITGDKRFVSVPAKYAYKEKNEKALGIV